MKDTYLSLVNGPLKQVAKTLGLPQPVELNRFGSTPASYENKPVLVLGTGPGAQGLADQLLENGLEVRRNAQTGEKLRAIIAVLDDAQSPADLSPVVLEIGAALRSLAACGRVVTISTAPDPQNQTPEQAATTQGITGFTRSVAHEMRAGATANGILLDGVDLAAPSVAAALWFLLSGKSAYVSGQFLTVSSDAGQRLSLNEFMSTGDAGPLAGRTAVVTGAARGIGAAIAENLARDGAYVIGVDMPQAGQALAQVMNRIGGKSLQLDITAADAPDKITEALGGSVDILIHNAGITRDKMLANMDAAKWDSVIAVNIAAQTMINARLAEKGTLRRWRSGRLPGLDLGNRGQPRPDELRDFEGRSHRTHGRLGGGLRCSWGSDQRGRARVHRNGYDREDADPDSSGRAPALEPAAGWSADRRRRSRRVPLLQRCPCINGQTLRVCGQNMVGA